MRDVNSLIADAFAGLLLSDAEVRVIANHIASAGFDPVHQVIATGILRGMVWKGETLQRLTKLPTADQHYLKHVRAQKEWPAGTSFEVYQADGARLAIDPTSGVFINRRGKDDAAQIGIFGRTPPESKGAHGYDGMLIEYHVRAGHWVTFFQPEEGRAYIDKDPKRKDILWLRQPK